MVNEIWKVSLQIGQHKSRLAALPPWQLTQKLGYLLLYTPY